MSTIEKIAKGLTIMAKYEGAVIAAVHDEIMAGLYKPCEISDVDKQELTVLGWRYDSMDGCWFHFV